MTIGIECGPTLAARMKSEVDWNPVLDTAIEDFNLGSRENAEFMLEAFLQWLSVFPARTKGDAFVMLKSDVDRVFHSLLLHTALYRDVCETYVGHFVDHSPVDGQEEFDARSALENTVNLLAEYYGEQLHPALKHWADMSTESAWRVSCKW